jgi:hypothetical protein
VSSVLGSVVSGGPCVGGAFSGLGKRRRRWFSLCSLEGVSGLCKTALREKLLVARGVERMKKRRHICSCVCVCARVCVCVLGVVVVGREVIRG